MKKMLYEYKDCSGESEDFLSIGAENDDGIARVYFTVEGLNSSPFVELARINSIPWLIEWLQKAVLALRSRTELEGYTLWDCAEIDHNLGRDSIEIEFNGDRLNWTYDSEDLPEGSSIPFVPISLKQIQNMISKLSEMEEPAQTAYYQELRSNGYKQ